MGLLSLCTPVGALIGSLSAKYLIALGRLKALYIANLIIFVGSILTLFESIPMMVAGRFL